jgi:hypothetical protein
MDILGGIALILLGVVAGAGGFSRRLRGVWKGGTPASAITCVGFALVFIGFGLAAIFYDRAAGGIRAETLWLIAPGLFCITFAFVVDFRSKKK